MQSWKRLALRALLIALLLSYSLMPISRVAATACAGFEGTALVAMPGETLTVSTVVKALTASKYQVGAQFAVVATVVVEGAGIRFWTDGTAPSSGVGIPVTATASSAASFVLCGRDDIKNFKAIRSGGTDATVTIAYARAR